MREYGNYYNKEDVDLLPLDTDNFLGSAVRRAKNVNDSAKQILIVRDAVKTLLAEAIKMNEFKINIVNSGQFKIYIAIFDYNGVVYYWWERYEAKIPFIDINVTDLNEIYREWKMSDDIYSNCIYTLEYKYREYGDTLLTYVGFSSNHNQSPLMCVGEFKRIKL